MSCDTSQVCVRWIVEGLLREHLSSISCLVLDCPQRHEALTLLQIVTNNQSCYRTQLSSEGCREVKNCHIQQRNVVPLSLTERALLTSLNGLLFPLL